MENQVPLLVETRQLTKVYGSGDTKIMALDQVDLQISPGELVAIMGPSGSGKSTLLNMLGALDLPTSGKVFIEGQDLTEVKNLDEFRAKKVGFIFQLHNLIPTLTSQENVEVPMIGHFNNQERRQRSLELLNLVGLAERIDHLPGQLSGGQRQRVAVARALANQPALILADEPTGNLDSQSGKELMGLLHQLNREHASTFIIVTHDPSVARMTDRVIVMADGQKVREDRVASPLEEDLKMWRYSGLGQKLLNGDFSDLDMDEGQIATLIRLLEETPPS